MTGRAKTSLPWIFAGVLLSGVVAIAIGSTRGSPKASAPTQATGTLHIVGDSQACRVGQLGGPNSTYLSGVTQVGVVNCKTGSTVADWNPPVIDSIPINAGDLVLVFLGSNQISATPDPKPIAQSVLKRGARVLWVGPPLIHGQSGAFIASTQAALASIGVPYFDSRILNLKQDAAGVHPVNAAEAARWLNAALAYAEQVFSVA